MDNPNDSAFGSFIPLNSFYVQIINFHQVPFFTLKQLSRFICLTDVLFFLLLFFPPKLLVSRHALQTHFIWSTQYRLCNNEAQRYSQYGWFIDSLINKGKCIINIGLANVLTIGTECSIAILVVSDNEFQSHSCFLICQLAFPRHYDGGGRKFQTLFILSISTRFISWCLNGYFIELNDFVTLLEVDPHNVVVSFKPRLCLGDWWSTILVMPIVLVMLICLYAGVRSFRSTHSLNPPCSLLKERLQIRVIRKSVVEAKRKNVLARICNLKLYAREQGRKISTNTTISNHVFS